MEIYGMFGVAEGEYTFTKRQEAESVRRKEIDSLSNTIQEMMDMRADVVDMLEQPGRLAITLDPAEARRLTVLLHFATKKLIEEKLRLQPLRG